MGKRKTLARSEKTQIIIFLLGLFLGGSIAAGSLEKPPQFEIPPLTRQMDPRAYTLALKAQKSQCSDQGCRQWTDYMTAQSLIVVAPSEACELFTLLSNDKSFPLYMIAYSKLAASCVDSAESARAYIEKVKNYVTNEKPKRWLKNALTSASLTVGQKLETNEFAAMTMEAERNSHSKKNKISLLEKILINSKNLSEERVKEIQSELWKISPKTQPIPNDWLSVGIDALSSHDPDLATTAFEKVVEKSPPGSPSLRQALEYLRQALKMSQRKKEASDVSEKIWYFDLALFKKQNGTPDVSRKLYNSGLNVSRLLWTNHRNESALERLKILEALLGKKFALNELHFVRARILEEQTHYESALKEYAKAAREITDQQTQSNYLWFQAWLNIKLKRNDVAITILQKLKEFDLEPGRKPQVMFWLAKSLAGQGKKDLANDAFEQLILDDPLGYYSLLSYRELNRPIPKPTDLGVAEFSKIPRKIAFEKPQSMLVFEWLISVKEFSLARNYLDEELPLPDLTVSEWEDVFNKYAQAGHYAAIFARVTKLSPAEKNKILVEHPEFLFPTPFLDIINESVVRTGLWPEFILAIMRQESSFDSLSVSPAHAFGLLQLLPSVARSLAVDSHSEYKEPSNLFDPGLNIELGSLHLRNYWDQFNGQFVLTTAAYNASPDTVQSWVANRFRGDPLQFIEDIPYEETRSYVKLVLRNFINYTRLASSNSSVPFPEWCLEGIHSFKN